MKFAKISFKFITYMYISIAFSTGILYEFHCLFSQSLLSFFHSPLFCFCVVN